MSVESGTPGGAERSVREQVAYLQGLMAGSGFLARDEASRPVWEALIGVVEGLAREVDRLREAQAETEEYIEAIDSDLGELEDEFYEDDEDEDEDDEFIEVTCPQCGREVTFEAEFLDDDGVEISCPECGTLLASTDEEAKEADRKTDGEIRVAVERSRDDAER